MLMLYFINILCYIYHTYIYIYIYIYIFIYIHIDEFAQVLFACSIL